MEGWGFRDEERRIDLADLTLQGDMEGGGQKGDGHFPPSLPPPHLQSCQQSLTP